MPITQSKEPKIVIENRLSTQQAKKLERLIEDTRNTDKDFSYTWEKLNSYLCQLINLSRLPKPKTVMPITQKPKPLRSTNDILGEIGDRIEHPEKYEQKPKKKPQTVMPMTKKEQKRKEKEEQILKGLNNAVKAMW
jgi:hypothetical protein